MAHKLQFMESILPLEADKMKNLRDDLKRAVAALAHQDDGEFLSINEKTRALREVHPGPKTPKKSSDPLPTALAAV